jgi:hypothetical protein
MSEQKLFQVVFSIVMLTAVASIPRISNYVDDCVDSYRKYRINKQAH